jgi:hypothetical protein
VIILTILVIVSSFIFSYLVNTSTITILKKRPKRVIPISLLTKGASWASFYIIGRISDWSIALIIADMIGDTLGDTAVAQRWPKFIYWFLVGKRRTKPYQKKTPVTTA